jgi:hypothetical protein
MCPDNQWKRVSKGLPWVGIMSPFDYKILDIRTFGGSSNVSTVELVAKQEFFIYRIVFLIMGIVLLSLASRLSKSVAFYYIGAMSIGIVILVTLIINQVKVFITLSFVICFMVFSLVNVINGCAGDKASTN